MNKHTPGPWEHHGHNPDGSYGIDAAIDERWSDVCLAIVNRRSGITRFGIEEAQANACLIVAAPDYFEAVEQMLLNEQCGGDGWWKGWDMLKAAHAKAKGEV